MVLTTWQSATLHWLSVGGVWLAAGETRAAHLFSQAPGKMILLVEYAFGPGKSSNCYFKPWGVRYSPISNACPFTIPEASG